MMIKIDKNTKSQLLELYKTKKICLEGNILKVIDSDGDPEFEKYIQEATEKDKEVRRKRLDVTRQVQSQNTDLVKWKKENERVNKQLTKALEEAEDSNQAMLAAKQEAESALKEAQKARVDAENARIEAEKARQEAEQAKNLAENDLELMQKKTQFELIGNIVKVALWVIMGVGGVVTAVYLIALFKGLNTDVIGSTWTNIVSILLTNSFSIVGTIMGVKYANQDNSKDKS
jgi:type IV secretory pathway VirB10-like protein